MRSLILALHDRGAPMDYAIAAVVVLLTAGTTYLTLPKLGSTITPPFFCAVMLAAWRGGFWPGIVATLLSIVFIHLLSAPGVEVGETLDLLVFTGTSVVISGLNALRRFTGSVLRRQQLELEVRVMHRTSEISAAKERLEREIAERQKAEKTIAESEERFRSLFEDAPVAYHEIDRDGIVRRVNKAECELLNRSADEILGRPVWELLVPEQREISRAAVMRKIATATTPERFTREYQTGDGETIVVEIHERLIWNSNGQVSGIRGAVLDITARVRAEEHIRRLNAELELRVRDRTEELEKSNEALQQFAYSASHDLQEPLRMVSSYTRLLQRKYQHLLDDDGREYMFYVVDGAERMSRLISDLLAFSRAGSFAVEHLEVVNMDEVVKTAVRNLETAIEESGAVVTSADLPRLWGRGAGLAQVVQNLVANSIKYRSDAPPQIRITCTESRDEYTFCVCDNGLGFEQSQAERAFGIFKRLHGRNYPGTGIGLAICKRIIERNGGRIWAESAPGQGSKFYFTLQRTAQLNQEISVAAQQ